MRNVDFEKAFENFIDRGEYDSAASALFYIAHIAFTGGWNAAGGNPPMPQKVYSLMSLFDDETGEIKPHIEPG